MEPEELETLEPTEAPENPEGDPTPTPPADPPFDVEAIRRQAFEEGFARAQQAVVPAPAPKPEANAEPTVDADLAYSDPAEYTRQMNARMEHRLNKQKEDILSSIAPTLRHLEQQAVVSRVTAGMNEDEREYAEQIAGSLNLNQLDDNSLKLLRYAAKGYAAEKNPVRVNPERPHSAPGGVTLDAIERTYVERGYYTEAEIRKVKASGGSVY